MPDKLSPWNSRDWASAFHRFTHSSKLKKWRPIILFLEENVDHIPKAVAKEPNLWSLVSLCDACSCAACNVLGFPDPWSVGVVAKSNLWSPYLGGLLTSPMIFQGVRSPIANASNFPRAKPQIWFLLRSFWGAAQIPTSLFPEIISDITMYWETQRMILSL